MRFIVAFSLVLTACASQVDLAQLLQTSSAELVEMKQSTRAAFAETYNLEAFNSSFTRMLGAE